MCELFAMSGRAPANVTFSLEEFSRHGGLSGPHKDGWGIAFFQDRDARIIREPAPAATSACVRFIESFPLRSSLVLSHIRRATQGKITLENTQPFTRELGGRLHVFVHNGDVEIESAPNFPCDRFRPIGDTDSERTFCALMHRLEDLWLRENNPPSLEERRKVLVQFARDLRPRGIANFLYCDGELLVAHGHKRHQSDGTISPPGLHFLCRSCAGEPNHEFVADGLHVTSDAEEQAIVLVASVPLTDECWTPMQPGEILVAAGGEILSRTRADEDELEIAV